MRRSLRRALALGAAASVTLLSGVASADPTPQDRAIAEAVFREGRALVDAGKIAEACPKFTESNRLDPKLGTLMYAATCHEQEGKTATAWVEFTEAVAIAQQAKQRDREKIAKDRVTALEGKLSRLSVAVAAPVDEQVVRLDGAALGKASYGVALPIDPGEHTLEAKAPGHKTFTMKVAIAADASTQKAELPALVADAPVVTTPPPPPPPVAPPAAPDSTRRMAGFALGGAAVVALGFGAFFGLRAASQSSDADAQCRDRLCTQQGLDGHDTAHTWATVSTVAFGIGLGASAGAIYLLLFDKPKAEPGAAATKVGLTPAGLRF